MADKFCLKMPDFHITFRDLLHAVNLRHGTNGFTSLPKEGVLRLKQVMSYLIISWKYIPKALSVLSSLSERKRENLHYAAKSSDPKH